MRVARKYGESLPKFASLAEAEATLFQSRDHALRALAEAARTSSDFAMDCTPDSIDALERWYFALLDRRFKRAPLDRLLFEHVMAMYLGECLVRNEGFEWHAAEYFLDPGAYELGVRRSGGSVMLSSMGTLADFRHRRNRRSMRDEYEMYSRFPR